MRSGLVIPNYVLLGRCGTVATAPTLSRMDPPKAGKSLRMGAWGNSACYPKPVLRNAIAQHDGVPQHRVAFYDLADLLGRV